MTIPVVWHISSGFWDQALPTYLLNRAASCEHIIGIDNTPEADVGVIVVPGQHSTKDCQAIRNAAANFKKRVVFLITGDEEGLFDAVELKLPHSITWWFAPPFFPRRYPDRVCIFGWPTDAPEMLKAAENPWNSARDLDWCFMGQVTHYRREQCVQAVQDLPNGHLLCTAGFSQGMPREEYYSILKRSKLVLCPSGPHLPDTFRFAEALEAGCIPIVDDLAPKKDYPSGYWNYVLDGASFPFPLVHDWATAPKVIDFWLKHWPANVRACSGWWTFQKREWVKKLQEDIRG